MRRPPIAIVGMACRFPGAAGVEEFWTNLREGRESISRLKAEQLRAAGVAESRLEEPEYVPAASVLEGVEGFDPSCFRLSLAEARTTDPQHRLFLECAWEALESAGWVPDLHGRDVGVFCGSNMSTYLLFHLDPAATATMDGIASLVGNDKDYLASRVSYEFDFTGPSVSVQTACSTSLVAVHMAVRSLADGECTMALAGGATIHLPQGVGYRYRAGGPLSPDGHCRAFDARAEGTVLGNGAGVVVLKPLARALADGDRISAVIRGSAVNNDGARKVGFAAPSKWGQAAVIREALAGTPASSIGYVEAHGTGTALGDPIEVAALTEAFGEDVERGSCALGSVKTNVGHLDSAAGVAGLIKTVLALEHGELPPSLHFERPNPRIDFAASPFFVNDRLRAWESAGPRRAGVSSFGIGGTNAHVVLEEAPVRSAASEPVERPVAAEERGHWLLPVSARSEGALRELAGAYARRLAARPHERLTDLCYSAGARRRHHPFRLAVTGSGREALAGALAAYGRGEESPAAVAGRLPEGAPRVVFVCSGQGSQWWGMGRDLVASEPVFRRWLEQCDAAFAGWLGGSLLAALTGSDPDSGAAAELRRGGLEVTQACLFAIQTGLARLWASWGVEPAAVVGHSVGEVAAAHVAGCLDFADAARVLEARARLLAAPQTGAPGRMVTVGAAPEALETALAAHAGRVWISAENSPSWTVVSGEQEAVAALVESLEGRGVVCRSVGTGGVAGHCPLAAEAGVALERRLTGLAPRTGGGFVSSVTGGPVDGSSLDAAYWRRNLVEPVRFRQAVEALLQDGHDLFVELSPHPVLAAPLTECGEALSRKPLALASLRRDTGAHEELLATTGALYRRGAALAWEVLYEGGRFVRLPPYPWQRRRHWVERPPRQVAIAPPDDEAPERHGELGRYTTSALDRDTHSWECPIGLDTRPELADHRFAGLVVAPAALHLRLGFLAARQVLGPEARTLRRVVFKRPLVLPEVGARRLQVVLARRSGAWSFHIASRAGGGDPWTMHAEGAVALDGACGVAPMESGPVDLPAGPWTTSVDGRSHYLSMEEAGVEYGPSFRRIQSVLVGSQEALAAMGSAPESAVPGSAGVLEPGVLDGGLQAVARIWLQEAAEGTGFVPHTLDEVRVCRGCGDGAIATWAHAGTRGDAADFSILGAQGETLLRARGLRARPVAGPARGQGGPAADSWLWELAWRRRAATEEESRPGRWLIVRGGRGEARAKSAPPSREREARLGRQLARRCEAAGCEVFALHDPTREDYRRLLAGLAGGGELGVVFLCPLEDEVDAEGAMGGCAGVLDLAQALIDSARTVPARVVLVTRNAQRVGVEETVSPHHAAVLGLGRTLATEHPELRCRRIDLDDEALGGGDLGAARLWSEIAGGEAEAAWRGAERWVPRLVARATSNEPPSGGSALPIAGERTVLVTGGLGGLGLLVARWLVEHGAGRVALLGRRPPSAVATREIAALRGAGAAVTVIEGDVTDRAGLAEILARIDEAGPPLGGIVHAAGVLADSTLARMTWERFLAAARPKVDGAWNLHQLTLERHLDFFVLFSSVGSMLGAPGQGNHAAGNAFLDALAHFRALAGLPALAVNWGPWSRHGAAAAAETAARFAAQGVSMIPPQEGLDLLGRLLCEGATQTAVMGLDRARLGAGAALESWSTLFEELVPAPAEGGARPTGGGETGGFRELLRSDEPSRRAALLESRIRQQVASVLRIDADRVERQLPLAELGLDSLRALELRNLLEADLAVRIPATLVWKCPTVLALARHLDVAVREDEGSEDVEGATGGLPPAQRLLSESEAEALLTERLGEIQR